MNNILMVVLVASPIIFGLAALLSPGFRTRRFFVITAAFITAAAGIVVGLGDSWDVAPANWLTFAGSVLELLTVLTVLAIGIKIRSLAVGLFAAIQFSLAIAGELLHKGTEGAIPVFVVDSLSKILVVIVSVIGAIIVVYAIGYMRRHDKHKPATAASTGQFFFFLIGFLGAMNGLVLANDLKWLSIFWEATTICSFVLIGHDGTSESRRNARRALIVNMFGGTALMAAAFIVLAQYGVTSITGIMTHAGVLAFALIALAGLTKSAQMPFQSWLLGAMVAPTPVSALLHSATMVNAGVYVLLRMSPAFAGTKMMYFVAMIGAFSFALTSALAIGQSNGKKVLAYSTIANLGLIVTCAGLNTPLAYAAALMLLCFHAASKGLLFLCMGAIEQNIGSRDIEDMGALLRVMPVTTVIALIGMASMLIPPFGMLLSKWMAIEAAIRSPIILLLLVIGSALTVLFWAKWIGRISTVSYHKKYTWERMDLSKMASLIVLGVIVLVAGFSAVPAYKQIIEPIAISAYQGAAVSAESQDLFAGVGRILTWPLFLFVAIALTALLFTFRRLNAANVRTPFLCGENIEGSQKTYEFRSAADQGHMAWCTSLYFRSVFEESRTTMWANLIAAMIVLSMFAVIGAR